MEKIWSYLIHLSENMWFDREDIGFTDYCGYAQAPCFRKELLCDDEVWDEVTEALPAFGVNTLIIDLGDGIRYESHPELAIGGSWDKQKLQSRLARLREAGIEPVPKLNLSAGHDTWLKDYSRRLSTPEYYRVTKELIEETCELFSSPKYFHLGMDEENWGNQAGYAYVTVRQGELWWHDLMYFARLCEGKGARPWIWSDYYWYYPEEFKRNMPKEILQSNWDYSAGYHINADGSFGSTAATRAYHELDLLGYDQVPTGSNWSKRHNIDLMVAACKATMDDSRLLGYMSAPWVFTTKQDKYILLDGASRLCDAKLKYYG